MSELFFEVGLSKSGGRNWIRTSEGVSQQIYSLPPLATWVSYQPSGLGGENMLKESRIVNERAGGK
jgi:hypothetical protein